MINFKEPTLDDKIWVNDILNLYGGPGSDDTFGSIFIWRNAYKTEICKYKNFLLRSYIDNNIKKYRFPIGEGDVLETINLLIDLEKENNRPFIFGGLTQNKVKILNELFPRKFDFKEVRGEEDYIYLSEDLAYLKGKKFHSKRNHISKFNRLYDCQYQDITFDNLPKCKSFVDYWFSLNQKSKGQGIESEYVAINEAFSNFDKLELIGGMITVEGKIVALTMGEKINNDTFDVHFEKALVEYSGVYAIINNEFVKRKLMSFNYINREEDLNIEGLRKVKLSYNPVVILKRYEAKFLG